MAIPNAREKELAAKWYVKPELLAAYREEVMAPIDRLATHYEAASDRRAEAGMLGLVAEALRERMAKDGDVSDPP